MSSEELTNKLKEIPLPERLDRCAEIIGLMCLAGRPPKMSIPVQWDDEDFFITETVREVSEKLESVGRRVLTCVYCGMEYPDGTPAWGSDVLTEHIKVCDKHPMRKAETTISRLREALVGLVGEEDPETLREMQAFLIKAPVCAADKLVTINAINALIKTMSDAKGKD